jgi:tripartite-type tricarboxylate transporter receptor subunit TctC
VVPWPPGGPADTAARPLAQKMSIALGQPVVVENRAGANGEIGTNYVAKAPPDGNTLLLANVGPMSISPHIQAQLPYDPMRDLTPISQLIALPDVLLVRQGLPANSLPELMALAKSKPGELTYGSVGIGGINHLETEMLCQLAGAQMLHVPYAGAPPILTELLAGRIDMSFISSSGARPHLQDGKLRALAVATPTRSRIFPDLPAVAETYPGFSSIAWHGLVGPRDMPRPVVERLYKESVAALRSDEMTRFMIEQGIESIGSSPDEFATTLQQEKTRWGKAAEAAGIRRA